jgi:hypothetical protein
VARVGGQTADLPPGCTNVRGQLAHQKETVRISGVQCGDAKSSIELWNHDQWPVPSLLQRGSNQEASCLRTQRCVLRRSISNKGR